MKALSIELGMIAAKKLHNTQGVSSAFKPRLLLVEHAYGCDPVLSDFEQWCDTAEAANSPNPIGRYLRQIDSRLGRRHALGAQS